MDKWTHAKYGNLYKVYVNGWCFVDIIVVPEAHRVLIVFDDAPAIYCYTLKQAYKTCKQLRKEEC